MGCSLELVFDIKCYYLRTPRVQKRRRELCDYTQVEPQSPGTKEHVSLAVISRIECRCRRKWKWGGILPRKISKEKVRRVSAGGRVGDSAFPVPSCSTPADDAPRARSQAQSHCQLRIDPEPVNQLKQQLRKGRISSLPRIGARCNKLQKPLYRPRRKSNSSGGPGLTTKN